MADCKRVHLITGAGSGMGQLAARKALESGISVAAIDVNSMGLAQLGSHANLLKLDIDITDFRRLDDAVALVERELGPISRVVNAAAIMPYRTILEEDHKLIDKVMQVNFGGLVNVAKATLPYMLKRSSGEFVSFSSLLGHVPIIYGGAYCASKAAVNSFSQILAHEHKGSGIKFLCVCPPVVDTPLLQQAKSTVWPKSFKLSPPIIPEQVLTRIEKGLKRGNFWVFPSFIAKVFYLSARFLPGLFWWLNHKLEQR